MDDWEEVEAVPVSWPKTSYCRQLASTTMKLPINLLLLGVVAGRAYAAEVMSIFPPCVTFT